MRFQGNRIVVCAMFLACVCPAFAQDPAPQPTQQSSDPPAAEATPDKRAFGVLPNYRTAEGSAPFVPISTARKFHIAMKDSVDYPSYFLGGAFAALYQLTDQNPSFGQGMKGYTKRYFTALSDQIIGNFMTEAIMPTVFKEDPRFFRIGTGSRKKRLLLAAGQVVVARTDHGNRTFNFAEFLGNGTVAAIGNTYYPDSVGFSPTIQRMFTQIGTDAISNMLKEFWPDIKHYYQRKKQQKH